MRHLPNSSSPPPHAASFAALAERCRARLSERVGHQEETTGKRLVRDLAALTKAKLSGGRTM